MEPSFGLSPPLRDVLRRAETQLRGEVQNVRDEIGFLAVHQAYADRYFPRTSVSHTRLAMVAFLQRSQVAGGIMVPYLAWIGFVSVLNFVIWRLNV